MTVQCGDCIHKVDFAALLQILSPSNLTSEAGDSASSSGNIFSSAALVAGTTVGAGILALPAATLPVGFLPSSALMLGSWLYMVVSGLLIAEANLQTAQQLDKKDVGLLTTIQYSLGNTGLVASGILYIFIHYALLIAYVARGGDLLSIAIRSIAKVILGAVATYSEQSISSIAAMPLWWGHLIFVVLFAVVLSKTSYRQVARFNSILVACVIAAFISLLTFTASQADITRLQVHHWKHISTVVPVMFVAFVYQNVVPVITKKLEGNRQKIQQSIWLGSLIPLLMFSLWNATILATVPSNIQISGIQAPGIVDPLEWLRSHTNNSSLSIAISVFSETAIATSFIGFVFGLLDVFEDIFSHQLIEQNRKLFFYSLTFIPPFFLSLLNPNIFFNAIDIAGAFGISILFGIIPALMIWKLRSNEASSISTLLGSPPLLVGMIAIATTVMLQKIANLAQ